jgi:hypothetical protein
VKALTANLATRPFRNNTVIGSIVAAVAATLLIATVYNLYIFLSHGSSYANVLDDQSRNRAKLEALEVEERSLVKQIEARDFATAFEQGSVANELILKRTFSWTELFNKLGDLMPPDVMMSAIRPNVTSSDIVIRVEGVAKTHLAFLNLQEHLLAHESFSEVYPVSIRRLNPSRPEITFILNFNYRQSERTPVDTVVAEASVPPQAAGAVASAAQATGERASLQEEVLRAAASANALPVGRDGRPRTLEVIARRMVAPGGVYDPPAAQMAAAPASSTPNAAAALAAKQAATAETGEKKGVPSAVAPAPVPQVDVAPSAPASSATPRTGAPQGTAATGSGPAGATPPGGEAATPAAAVPETTVRAEKPPATDTAAAKTPNRSRRSQRRRPAKGATGGAKTGTAGAAPGAAAPSQTDPATTGTSAQAGVDPATQPPVRPDVYLNFANQPVRDVYRILGEAHNVRFVVDAAIDRNSILTVDLTGLSMKDVITVMAGVANQRIKLIRPGIYQVVAISKGENLIEPAVQEENLPATEGAP